MKNKIILYTTHCPKCKVLESKLKNLNISYEVCEDLSVMESLNILSAPALKIDDTLLDFGQAIKWLKEIS